MNKTHERTIKDLVEARQEMVKNMELTQSALLQLTTLARCLVDTVRLLHLAKEDKKDPTKHWSE